MNFVILTNCNDLFQFVFIKKKLSKSQLIYNKVPYNI